jgi:hypothetical protein
MQIRNTWPGIAASQTLATGILATLQLLITERVEELRQEIAEILEANHPLPRRSKHRSARADHERRLERLREIMGELLSLLIHFREKSPAGTVTVPDEEDE